MDPNELHTQLLEDARRYDPAAHTRGLLAPFRDVLLLQRAKFMSYEQISATLARHGLRVSPAAVGIFCRRQFTKTEIESARRPVGGAKQPTESASTRSADSTRTSTYNGQRGPKIARKDL
ncbi:MAG: hypothetical protein PSU94_00130 [Lacunisphaera sp.]|nr:hypothetical protein [Lacunisphaera sp.]